ncbi:hypothetical protein U7230_02905 [Carboxydochorda subterranea]|uniref:Uncharacterized protein n=1 Tax=Carboxydichorda subterranea TaxID=3109565 RepID=A0ABZ1C0X5_9FIRM|nr:hypothetical protein [Limnochorda sp. L945t]WRP17977.1 hypothetical protein U7230_02905 [Limnochorda sp. L945t]
MDEPHEPRASWEHDDPSPPHAREEVIRRVMEYVREHPESFASLAVCRRALGAEPGGAVDEGTRRRLGARLETVPDDELEAYYYIVS